LLPEGTNIKIEVTLPPLAVKNSKTNEKGLVNSMTVNLKNPVYLGQFIPGNAAMPLSALCVASRRYKPQCTSPHCKEMQNAIKRHG